MSSLATTMHITISLFTHKRHENVTMSSLINQKLSGTYPSISPDPTAAVLRSFRTTTMPITNSLVTRILDEHVTVQSHIDPKLSSTYTSITLLTSFEALEPNNITLTMKQNFCTKKNAIKLGAINLITVILIAFKIIFT
jgi:hypothetical protein